MTMTNGYRQIACQHCLTRYKVPNYTSINLMASERWSDGRRVNSLFDNGYGIRHCKCGKYYRLAEAIDMGLLVIPQTQEIEVDEHGNEIFNIPAFLLRGADETFADTVKNDAKSFAQKLRSLFGKKRDEKQKLTKKIVVQQPLPADRVQHIPNAVRVNDSEMFEIVKDKDLYSNDMVLAARERYRMHLNDKYREPFKDYCKDRSRPIPDYEVSDEHLANTKEILSSYLNSKKIDWMDVGDLYRELGEFAKALECFGKAKNSEHNEADLERFSRACAMKISNPLPI